MTMSFNILGWVMAGGALGAVARYVISGWIPNQFGIHSMWGTFGVNVVGCFLIGITWSLIDQGGLPQGVKWVLITGFLGAFTTFSTYSLDIMHLADNSRWPAMIGYFIASNGVGIAAAIAGARLLRLG